MVATLDERVTFLETRFQETHFDEPFQDASGQEWTAEEWDAIGQELYNMNSISRRLLAHIDNDLIVQQDTLRQLQLCVAILQDSNNWSRLSHTGATL